MRVTLPIMAAAAAISVAGCAPVDVGLGESVRYHMAAQTIDPNPKQKTDLVEGGEGQHSADAVKRYREGKVKDPRPITTTNIQTGGGNGGPGGGAPK